jgi:hypothetical protein
LPREKVKLTQLKVFTDVNRGGFGTTVESKVGGIGNQEQLAILYQGVGTEQLLIQSNVSLMT